MGALSDFFYADHRRLEGLISGGGKTDQAHYDEFRAGLLRHFEMEERNVLPAIVEAKGGKPLLTARRVRLEHAALVSLLVPPPITGILRTLRTVLLQHILLEEGPGGIYESCEQLLGATSEEILRMCREIPETPPPPNNLDPAAIDAACRALKRAGFEVSEEELRS